jgi:hypothetical protein
LFDFHPTGAFGCKEIIPSLDLMQFSNPTNPVITEEAV